MSEEHTDYWYRRFRGTVEKATVSLNYGGPWDYERTGYWNVMHGRSKTPYVANPQPEPPQPPAPNPDTPPVPPPDGGIYGRVLHDYEVYGMSRPEWLEMQGNVGAIGAYGFPETVPALDWRMVPMDKDWQFYWFGLLWLANPELSEADAVNLFRKITRSNAFKTNKAGAESGYANYVTRENLGAPPMKTGILWTGGAYLRILEDLGNKYKVEMLNMHQRPPSLQTFDGRNQTPTVYFATTSNRGDNGTRVIPLTGGPTIPVPSVAMADYAYIAKNRVVILPTGSRVPRPYNP